MLLGTCGHQVLQQHIIVVPAELEEDKPIKAIENDFMLVYVPVEHCDIQHNVILMHSDIRLSIHRVAEASQLQHTVQLLGFILSCLSQASCTCQIT